MVELTIREWRITRGVPFGTHLWFDPSRETVRLYELLPGDGEVAPDASEGVDIGERVRYLDKVGSVSGNDGDGDACVQKYEQISFIPEEKSDLPF